MQAFIEQIKKIYTRYFPGGSHGVHYIKLGYRPRRDWFFLLMTFFGSLVFVALFALYTNYSAEHETKNNGDTNQTSIPVLDTHTLTQVETYFKGKSQQLQNLQSGMMSIPRNPF